MAKSFVTGVDSYDGAPAAAVIGQSPITLACWVNVTNAASGFEAIMQVDLVGFADVFAIYSSSGNILCESRNGGSTVISFFGSVSGVWRHVAMTWDVTNGVRAYLNGVQQDTDADATVGRPNWARMLIGFGGVSIQNAMFFSRALEAPEIAALAARQLPANPSNLEFWLPLWTGTPVDLSGKAVTVNVGGAPADSALHAPVGWFPRTGRALRGIVAPPGPVGGKGRLIGSRRMLGALGIRRKLR